MTVFFYSTSCLWTSSADVLGASVVKSDSGIYLIDLIIIIVVMDQAHKLTLLLIA